MKTSGGSPVGTTCLIADDHPALRESFKYRLELDVGLTFVAECGTGDEALEQITALQPDLALLDLRMPGIDGIGVVSAVKRAGISTRMIIFSAMTNPTLVERAIKAGAHGYLGKETHFDVLRRAIDIVLSGKLFIDPTLAADLIGGTGAALSEREQTILEMMADGKPNKVIAHELGITSETIKTHVSNIMQKLNVDNRTSAIALAFRSSLVE